MILDAFHLPGLDLAATAERGALEYPAAGLTLRYPRLRGADVDRIAARLRAAGSEHLDPRPVVEIVRILDRAAARLADPGTDAGALARELLTVVTGYSRPMADLILERAVPDWREPALRALLQAEFSDPAVLDAFVPAPAGAGARRRRAYGAALAFHVFAGNVPGVAVTSLVRSLLVKSPVLGKTAAGEPLLPVLFARALAEVDPGVAACLGVTYWPGGTAELESAAARQAELVVAYGGEAAVQELRRRLPAGTRFVAHGPRLSFGLVGREAVSDPAAAAGLADDVARAVATFDQQGCVSPHVVYVEEGDRLAPAAFAALVADRLAAHAETLPRGAITTAEASGIRQARGAAEMREAAGHGVRVFAAPDTAYTVIFDPEPEFTTSCLNRLLWVKPVRSVGDVPDLVRRYGRFLQTAGVALDPRRLAEIADALARAGVTRIASFRDMPWPPPSWHHDGAEPLRELVRWVDLEASPA